MVLYLIATPIGNLQDFSHRAILTIQACDYLLCEDTRHSLILLKHYAIPSIPLYSFHKFSESAKSARILKDLQEGKTIGLLSDAGTPGISDPGTSLVQKCREAGLEVIAIPGPCAALVALSASGLSTHRFQFLGFLPRKKGALKRLFEEALLYPGTSICYESPHRILSTLQILAEIAPTQPCVLARELTKKFEEYRKATASELFASCTAKPPKGEITLLICGSE